MAETREDGYFFFLDVVCDTMVFDGHEALVVEHIIGTGGSSFFGILSSPTFYLLFLSFTSSSLSFHNTTSSQLVLRLLSPPSSFSREEIHLMFFLFGGCICGKSRASVVLWYRAARSPRSNDLSPLSLGRRQPDLSLGERASLLACKRFCFT